ncbi:chemotaxis protein CheB [Couchioplanes caeruleus]|uniref:protein-glutamate methylesterase n=2 Tax=Couchioplanes caeruleus TaxID=56438 RepID=A0A1K0GHB6_9ACTN|nr:chemotaxis protein CheB [Couchioplanes caeruleus]OJF10292.1 chemotaxis protein CheB [Couchioplanes caeruleus subsp. caeruleus]ROP34228.1 two-component system chemotaxis response regulator CheB [Couchioplanes caeruleus]
MTVEHRDVVVVGASAGGVEALRALVGGLPPDYPGAVLVVLHVPRDSPSALPAILSRSGPLPATAAVDGEELRHGRVYVAPNDHHLLILDGRIRLTRGPAENGHRPAVDPLFRSAARAYAERVIGVVLSGARDDGAAGLASIAARGGTTVVQAPEDALHASMPRAAIDHATPDHIVPVAKMGALIAGITAMDLPEHPPRRADQLLEAEVAISELGPLTTDELDAAPAGFGCPACGGSLFQLGDKPVPRYRCRVGHAWSPESLLDEQAIALEGALWMALRALEEKSALSRRMAGSISHRHPVTTARFHDMAHDAEAAGETIRRLIAQLGSSGSVDDPAPSS